MVKIFRTKNLSLRVWQIFYMDSPSIKKKCIRGLCGFPLFVVVTAKNSKDVSHPALP